MEKVVLATNNKHKAEEYKRMLAVCGYTVSTLAESGIDCEVEETADTFDGNALLKASAIAKEYGVIAIADDSGLVVDCLDGAPGVFSARYAGEHATSDENIEKLLNAMKDVPEEKRTARFVCTICFYRPDNTYFFVHGKCEGRILTERDGEGGFGYDPVFYSDELQCSFGIATAEQKDSVSHRGKALRSLIERINNN